MLPTSPNPHRLRPEAPGRLVSSPRPPPAPPTFHLITNRPGGKGFPLLVGEATTGGSAGPVLGPAFKAMPTASSGGDTWFGGALRPQAVVTGEEGRCRTGPPVPTHLAPWRLQMGLIWLQLLHKTEVMKV